MDKKKRAKRFVLILLEILALIIAACIMYVVVKTTGGVEKVEINQDDIAVNEEVKQMMEEAAEVKDDTYSGVFNIAFFGVDARDGSLGKGNRSDTIMLCSIDMDSHEVRLISIYRDTYLNLGNDSYNKCNTSYARGGPEQAIGMINMNLDMYVTDYITVGFEGLIDAVDALGGIEIEISEAEISHLNNYQSTMAEEMGVSYVPVRKSGKQLLNGLQATAYCRIRYTSGDDFKRAERQRNLLIAMIEKAKGSSIGKLNDAMNAVLPNIRTSLGVEDILPVLSMVGDYKVTVSDGFPFAEYRNGGTIGTKGSCVVPESLEENVVKLHQLLFADESYEPSKDVKHFSKKIEEDTKPYLEY